MLFYFPTGSLTFDNNASVSISPESGYQGVSIWAAGNGASVNLANNASEVNAYGGIYAPHGAVTSSSGGTMSAQFILSSSASFWTGTVINVTTP